MSIIKNPAFTSYEHWSEHNDDPADVKRQKPQAAQIAKTDKGRVMQWVAEERELAFSESEGQDPESILITKQEAEIQRTKRQLEKPKKKSDGEYLTKKTKSLLKFNKSILNQVADEADQLDPDDADKAHRLIARLEGLKLPAVIDRKLENDYQDVIDANQGRKEQLETINSVLDNLYRITEKADEEKNQVKELTYQTIAEFKNIHTALAEISKILSVPKEKRMPNWYQVVQGRNREVLQASRYLLSLFTRARIADPDLMLKAYPKVARRAPEVKQDYCNAVIAFTATHNHFDFSKDVLEEARRHNSPLARGIDEVMSAKRPEKDDVLTFHAKAVRLPRKKVKEVLKKVA